MPANTSPIFILTPNVGTGRIAAANTASDGSGSLVQVLTGGTNGTRVDAVRFRNSQATAAASSAMVHRIFYSPPGGGSFRLIGEVATAAATRSTSAIGATSIYTFDVPLFLPSGSGLHVCQSVYAGVQDQVDVQVFAGDY